MKILHVLPALSPRLGGPTVVAINLVRELNLLGVNTEIATTSAGIESTKNVLLSESLEYQGVPVRFFKPGWLQFNQVISSWPMSNWLRDNVVRYDLIDIHYLFTCATQYAVSAAMRSQVPYTMRAMGQLTSWSLSHHKIRKMVWGRTFERSNLNRAALIHCTSSEEVADVRRYGVTTPTSVSPLGVEIPVKIQDARRLLHQRLSLREDIPIILFLSRIHPKKNAETAINVLAGGVGEIAHAHLVIAGDGDSTYLARLKKLANKQRIDDRVHFIGFVEGATRDYVLQGCDVFVLPSYSENFGIAVIEAMAAGAPVVISSAIQIAREIESIGAGVVIDPIDLQSWSHAINRLLVDRDFRIKQIENGLEMVDKRFRWSTIARELSMAYQSILSAKICKRGR